MNLEIEYLKALRRRSELSQQQQFKLASLEKGIQGELEFGKLLNETIPESWLVFYDLNLNLSNYCQIDYLILTNKKLLHFEVKNYSGHHHCLPHGWFKGDRELSHHPFHQIARTRVQLRDFIKQHQLPITVQSYLVFMNIDFELTVTSDETTPWYYRHQIKQLLHDIAKEDHSTPSDYIIQKFTHALDSRRVKQLRHFYQPPDFIQTGVYCPHCNRTIEISRKNIYQCSCGQKHTKSELLLDQMRDYALLYLDRPLTTSAIDHFTNGAFKRRTIRRAFKENLNRDKTGLLYHYKNPFDTV